MMLAIPEQSEGSKKEAIERAKISAKLMQDFLESSTEWNNNKTYTENRKKQEALALACIFNYDFSKEEYVEKSPKILEENLTKITSFISSRDEDLKNINSQLSKILLSRDTNKNDNDDETLNKMLKNLQRSFISQSKEIANASKVQEILTKTNLFNNADFFDSFGKDYTEKSQKLLKDNLSKITTHSVDRIENLAQDIENHLKRVAINRVLNRYEETFDSEYTTFDRVLEDLKYANSSTMYNPFYWSNLLNSLKKFVIKSNAKKIIERFFKEKKLKTHIDDILPNTLVQLSVLSLLDVGLDYDEKSDAKKNFLLKRKTELEKEIKKNIATYKSILNLKNGSYELNNLTEDEKTKKQQLRNSFFINVQIASDNLYLYTGTALNEMAKVKESEEELQRFKTVSFEEKNKVGGTEFEKILASGFDFLPSHYNAYFSWHTNSTATTQFDNIQNKAKSNTMTDIEKLFLNSDGLAVRMTSINIPQMKNVSYTVGGVHHDIKKISSSKNISRKSTFTFRLDSGLAWINLFGQLYGENNFYTISDEEIKSWSNTASDRRQYIHTIANCLSSKSSAFGLDKHLCLDITQFNRKRESRHIKFEDIKIISAGNDITYSSDGGITDLSIEFIYKRMSIIQ